MTLQELLKSKRIAVSGDLKYLYPQAYWNLEEYWPRKVCRKLNGFRWNTPLSLNQGNKRFEVNIFPRLKDVEVLLIPEDQTAYNKALVEQSKRYPCISAVVQHGYPCHRYGFTPLRANYLIAWEESIPQFLDWGISPSRIIKHEPQAPTGKHIQGIEAVLFLVPPYLGDNSPDLYDDPNKFFYSIQDLYDIAVEVCKKEPNLVIKNHPKGMQLRCEKMRFTREKAYDLIYSAKRVYAFRHCTTRKDAEVMGKRVTVVGR